MQSIIYLGLVSAALMPFSALACANYRAELTKDGSASEPSISKLRVEFEDDCRIFCSTKEEYIESTSDNEWIIPCSTDEVILVVKERGNLVEFRREGPEGELNYSWNTKSLTDAPKGGKYFAHNPYCPPPVNGLLVPGQAIPWPSTGWKLDTC